MNYTNLNIVSEGKVFKYIVEYYDDPTISTKPLQYYKNDQGIFFISADQVNMVHKKNYWYNEYDESTASHKEEIVTDYVPASYNISSFNLYFPQFSVETYNTNFKYILTINTWVNGKYVFLGSYLLDRNKAIAHESGVKKFLNDEYYEYIHIDTIDPTYLIYGDEWKDFRVNVCGEKITNDIQANNTASNLNITLTPVKFYEENWLKMDNCDSSQSALLLMNSINNYMNASLEFDIVDGYPQFNCKVKYNSLYSSLNEYLLETYQIDSTEFTSKFVFMYRNKDNLYKAIEHTYAGAEESTVFSTKEIQFSSWEDYTEGTNASCVYVLSKDDADILILSSNRVMINPEVFKYLIFNQYIKKVNFDETSMTTNSFDVVNIIENKVVTVERPDDYKSNIVKSVFVKVQDATQIRLHPLVTENIVLNLDAYKNKVDAFTLKIGDANFYETGRINSGIVFKIVGSNLNTENVEGVYYILDDNGELVTSGNYILIQ